MLTYYGRSLYNALSYLYPHHTWLPWKFRHLPRDWSSDLDNQRSYLEWARGELKLSNLAGWYSVKASVFRKVCGRSIIGPKYNDSLRNMLYSVYSEHPWEDSKFVHLNKPRKAWGDVTVRRRIFETAMKNLSLASPRELASVKVSEFIRASGAQSLIYNRYNGSLEAAISDTYPELGIPPPKARQKRGYARRDPDAVARIFAFLKDDEMQRNWLVALSEKLNLEKISQLSSHSSQDFLAYGGALKR